MVVPAAGLVLSALLPVLIGTAQPALTLRDPAIVESSGMATSSYDKNLVLTHNDSGGRPEYFAVDTRSGKTVLRVPVPGATNVDWEDIAVGGHTVYLADIGDNRATRSSVTIYAVPEARTAAQAAPARVTRLTYDDGPRDAEALLVPPGGQPRYVVSKQLFGAGVYAIEGARLRHVADLTAGLITGGSWSPDGTRIALVSYTGIFVYDAAAFPAGPAQRLALPPLRQAESITWSGNDAVLVGSEGVHSPVYRVAVPNAAAATPAPVASPTPSETRTAPGTATAPTPGATGASTGVGAARGRAGLPGSRSIAALVVVAGLVAVAVARVRRRSRGGLG
ncbi:MAG: hypothetical protein QOF57_2590 [Frankiaceae bacterium]|nr:hypothetical protein [Frankiaceae bacterium]